MFLKSMEIRGFKSFADKTELLFKKGVTAVVGPNGSGKSNISDAVRWVLGEQSVKSLRGGKMEDVIFAGTQFRKPVGLAQVALTLDNCDGELPLEYSDVTISRRLYRSGESEYYINNTHCRLKDIQELFMDTGIGKEGYSIIGQGKIDAILSGRPEERRNLLEEAAGIVKFKSRKEEAQKRLEATNQNLIRINDILNTYEERLEPLRIDSEKANSFLALSQQLKIKEVNLIVNSIENIQQRVNTAIQGIEKLENELADLIKQRLELKEKHQNENQLLDAHEREIEQFNKKYYEDKQLFQSLNSEIDILNERLKNLDAQIERSSIEVKDIEEKALSIASGKSNIEENLKIIHEKQRSIDLSIIGQEEELLCVNNTISAQTEEAKESTDREFELVNEISETKNSLVILNNQKEQSLKRNEQIENSLESFKNSISINSNTKSLLVQESENVKRRIDQYEEDIKSIKSQVNDVKNNILNQERELKEKSSISQKLETNRNVLVNLDKQHEGYNKSSKLLMQDLDKGAVGVPKGTCFILGEVITVDKHLETAVEISLGGAISDIITPDETTAKRLISYLKENRLGRATFLPLNILKARVITEKQKFSQIKGFVGIANELVKFDGKFKNAIDFVLGRTIISSDMDSALQIAKISNYSYRIVTLAGETINPGGSMSGGSLQVKATNVIGRKREIDELNNQITETHRVIEDLNLSLEQNKQLGKELDDNILNLKDSIYAESIEITKISGKVTAIDKENEKLRENLNISQSEMNLIKNQIDGIKVEMLEKNTYLEQLIIVQKEKQESIAGLSKMIEDNKTQAMKIRENLTERKIEKAQIDETVANKIKDLERLAKELDDLSNKKNSLISFINDSMMAQTNSLRRIEELKASVLAAEQAIEEYNNIIKKNEAKKIELKESISRYENSLEQLSLLLSKNEDEKHRLELQQARIETEKEGLYKKLNEELQLTFAEAIEFKLNDGSFNAESFKREASNIKAQIAALGVVNVGAIEEYKEVKEKHGFMSGQRDDLLKSIDELNNVILDMTEIMKNVFNENFTKLRENFNLTFMELFKGGSADLILGEGDELSANIDINVQPPGKKLQNINLMSGGEKVLSAIALLFAILKMKPTPFCILDEIEAALDDANVFRYAEFLKKFSSNIQFIVITHRKGTMESSDVLYGVTMEEKGVSKIVSVDLSKK